MASFAEIRKQFMEANKGKKLKMNPAYSASSLPNFDEEYRKYARPGEGKEAFRKRRAREQAERRLRMKGL